MNGPRNTQQQREAARPSLAGIIRRLLRNRITPDDYERLRGIYLALPLSARARTRAKHAFLAVCRALLFTARLKGRCMQRLRRRLLGKNDLPDDFDSPFSPPVVTAAPQADGKADYFVFGVIDWRHLFQRPQHLSRCLARQGHRVFFISPLLKHAPRKGFSLEQIDEAGADKQNGESGRLFSIRLNAYLPLNIHYRIPDSHTEAELLQSFGELLRWAGSGRRVFLVEHPAWHGLVSRLPGGPVVYDCMDHHAGFSDDSQAGLLHLENALLAWADLTVVTSQWLADAVSARARRTALIRNACEFEHFRPAAAPAAQGGAPQAVNAKQPLPRTIGYYGMIAPWFDLELLEKLAQACPDCRIELIGRDAVDARGRLKKYPCVRVPGEVPYAELPARLREFDVCLLPFKPLPLIQATNPVKVYEYLSAGKPVVGVDIPEMRQFGDLVYRAEDHAAFVQQVRHLLDKGEAADLPARRQAFAAAQTWEARARKLAGETDTLPREPGLSVIIVTYNNLELTKRCLRSLDRHTAHRNTEFIVVDNASTDGTPDFLETWRSACPLRQIILNADNRGFAAANNQGLALSSGKYLTLLNNDTFVTPGWDAGLMRHLERDPGLGLLCPVTNNIGNEARIDITYASMDEMREKALHYTSRRLGQIYPLRTTAFFCVMMPRSVYEAVGPISEDYGRGWFEDDDYCRRVEERGYRMACAEDVFVHHELSASFNTLPSRERQELFARNRAIYEKKWGAWTPHQSRIRA